MPAGRPYGAGPVFFCGFGGAEGRLFGGLWERGGLWLGAGGEGALERSPGGAAAPPQRPQAAENRPQGGLGCALRLRFAGGRVSGKTAPRKMREGGTQKAPGFTPGTFYILSKFAV